MFDHIFIRSMVEKLCDMLVNAPIVGAWAVLLLIDRIFDQPLLPSLGFIYQLLGFRSLGSTRTARYYLAPEERLLRRTRGIHRIWTLTMK